MLLQVKSLFVTSILMHIEILVFAKLSLLGTLDKSAGSAPLERTGLRALLKGPTCGAGAGTPDLPISSAEP